MANLILGFPNQADKATLAGGSWVSTLPLTNLQDRRISKKARSSNATLAATKFTFALDKSRVTGLVAIVGHNLSATATWRVTANTSNSFTTPAYDSGWDDVWSDVSDVTFGTLEWESDSFWTWKISDEESAYYPGLALNIPTTAVSYQYWQIEFNDTTNSAGYIQIGRLFIGSTWQVTNNASYGWSLAYEDGTLIEEGIGGAEYYDTRPRYRVMRIGLDYLTKAEATSTALGASRVLGTTGEVLLIWDKDDSDNIMRRSFLGRLRTLNPIENPDPVRYTTAYEIKEIIA